VAADELRVDVNLKDADMLAATRLLTQRTGLQFVVKPSTEPFGKITLKLDKVTPEKRSAYLPLGGRLFSSRDESGVYIISRTPFEQPKEAEPAVTTAPAPAKATFLRRLKIMKADVRDLFDMVVHSLPMRGDRGFEDIKRFARLHETTSTASSGSPPDRFDGTPLPPCLRTSFLPRSATGTCPCPTWSRQATSCCLTRQRGSEAAAVAGGAAGFGGGQGGLGGGQNAVAAAVPSAEARAAVAAVRTRR
jgi:hypothetical protein